MQNLIICFKCKNKKSKLNHWMGCNFFKALTMDEYIKHQQFLIDLLSNEVTQEEK